MAGSLFSFRGKRCALDILFCAGAGGAARCKASSPACERLELLVGGDWQLRYKLRSARGSGDLRIACPYAGGSDLWKRCPGCKRTEDLHTALSHYNVPKDIPVDAFWSISIYEVEPDGRVFFADNPIHRYAIGDRTRGLKHNADGSIDILVQRDKPAEDQLANWLPAPASGHAHLSLRLYQPRAEILNGSFAFPALETLD